MKVSLAPFIHKINDEKEKLKRIKLKIAPLFSQYREPKESIEINTHRINSALEAQKQLKSKRDEQLLHIAQLKETIRKLKYD